MRKVALIETHAIPGVWKYDLALAMALERRGLTVSIFSAKSFPDVARAGFSGNIYRDFPNLQAHKADWVKGILYLFATIRTIIRVRMGDYEVVHWQHYNTLPIAELLLARFVTRRSVPMIMTVHDVKPWSSVKGGTQGVIARTFARANRYIVHHRQNRDELSKHYGISRDRIDVVHHGSYTCFQDRMPGKPESRAALGLDQDRFVCLFFGEVRPEKGLDILLNAMSKVVEKANDVLLVVAGRPRHVSVEQFKGQVSDLKIAGTVDLRFGYIPDDDVPRYFASADIVVLPYREISQSGVLFEAMTAGRPVVVSDVGAIGPTVRENKIGVVVAPGDSGSLAKAIIDLASDTEYAAELGKRSLEVAKDKYSWDACATATVESYRAALAGRAPS